MKKVFITTLLLQIFCVGFSQVQIKTLPKPGYEKRIREYVDNMKVVDTHEHLRSFAGLTKASSIDFMELIFQYGNDELTSAGMHFEAYPDFRNLPVHEKWKAIRPYWEGSSNTAINRGILLSADKLFGVNDIDSSTVEVLSQKIAKAYENPQQWMDHVLKEKCGIDFVIEDILAWWAPEDNLSACYVRYVKKFDPYISLWAKSDLEKFKKWKSSGIQSLDELVEALGMEFADAVNSGIVGVKSALAYELILKYENVGKEVAERVYSHRLMSNQVVFNVLTDKVRDGYFTEAEAIKIAQMILHDNAVRILNLK